MRHTTLLFLIALCVIFIKPVLADLPVTAPPQAQGNNAAEEAAWQSLQSQMPQSRRVASVNGLPAQASAQAQQHAQVAQAANSQPAQPRQGPPDWAAIARKSRDFLAQYPNSAHAQEARKFELVAELGPSHGKGAIPSDIQAKTNAYLADAAISETDRFDVSRLNKNARMLLRTGMKYDEVQAQHLQNAQALATEFPGDERAWAELLRFAQLATGQDATDAATRIIDSTAAPEQAKQIAQQLRDRRSLVGQPIPSDDPVFAPGKPLMIYFWSVKKPGFLPVLQHCSKIEGVAFVGINMDADETQARDLAAQLALPGTQVYDGAEGALAGCFHVDNTPAIYLADASGKIVEVDIRIGLPEKLRRLALAEAATTTSNSSTNEEGGRQ